MARKAVPKQLVTVEELLRACLCEQEALRRELVRKGLVSNGEVLEEVEAVRRSSMGSGGGRESKNVMGMWLRDNQYGL